MRVTVTALHLTKKKGYRARKGIPADVRDEYRRLFGPGWEAKMALPAGMPPVEARARFAQWLSEVETRIETIRARQRGEAQELAPKEARALAGEWYVWFLQRHEGQPGDRWSLTFDMLVEELRTLDPEGMYAEGQNVDLERVLQDNRAGIRPLIADWAHTAQFLASRGVVLTVGARDLFLDHVASDYLAAISLLQQRAKGDYSPDDRPQQFPPFTRREKAQGLLSPWALFDQWVQEKKPASSTIGRWRAVFLALEARFKDGISEDAARQWVRSLVNNKRSARTVADTWLSAASTIYKWAAEQKLIASNPFAKVKVTIPRKSKTRDKAFTPEEAQTILRATLASDEAVKRWVPWLCAYSGARAGEITQVRGQDIEQRDGFFAMKLTPEAGTIKTRTARTVPLHEHLLKQGFLEFVKTRGRGPLFYTPVAKREDDPLNPRTPKAAILRMEVAAWVRKIGVDDPGVSPNHSWRHLFKQIAERHGISERVSDAITGHAPTTAGRGYGTPNLEDMARELGKFPRYKT